MESDEQEPERPGSEPAGTPAGRGRKKRRKKRRKRTQDVPTSDEAREDSKSVEAAYPLLPAAAPDVGDEVVFVSLDDDDDTPIEETMDAEALDDLQGPARTSIEMAGRLTTGAELSSPAARARLVAQALAHAETRDARYRLPMPTATAAGWRGALSLGIVLLAAFVALAPPSFIVPEPLTLADDVEQIRGARMALHLQARQIEAFRARNERLPSSLDEIRRPVQGVRFVRSDGRVYQLVAYGPRGQPIIFDSAAPAPIFDSIAAALSALDGRP